MIARVIVGLTALAIVASCAAPSTMKVASTDALTGTLTPAPIPAPAPTATFAPTAPAEEPAGGYLIAFASGRDNMSGIYVTDLRGRSVHLITRQSM